MKITHQPIDDDKYDEANENNVIHMKIRESTMRFVRMFYKSWTRLFQNLGFETARINFGWRAQWQVTPWKLEMKPHRTAHLPLS